MHIPTCTTWSTVRCAAATTAVACSGAGVVRQTQALRRLASGRDRALPARWHARASRRVLSSSVRRSQAAVFAGSSNLDIFELAQRWTFPHASCGRRGDFPLSRLIAASMGAARVDVACGHLVPMERPDLVVAAPSADGTPLEAPLRRRRAGGRSNQVGDGGSAILELVGGRPRPPARGSRPPLPPAPTKRRLRAPFPI
jgi:hypothetical protein